MKKIADKIIEKEVKDLKIEKKRYTVRGIMIKDKKVLMVYSHQFLDYTFPGGGINEGEDHIAALHRELNEEVGALEITNIRPYGYMEEKKFSLNSGKVYLQTSFYYFVEINSFGEQSLEENELIHGVEPMFVTIDEAIKQNLYALEAVEHKQGMKTVVPREIKVLESLRKVIK